MDEEKELPQYAIELRKAIGNQELTEIGKRCGIAKSTLNDLYNGKIAKLQRVRPDIRKKLWKGLDVASFYSPLFEPIDSKDSFSDQLQKYIIDYYQGRV